MSSVALPVVDAAGNPFAIGAALRRHARAAIHTQVRRLPEFRALLAWLGDPYLGELEAAARRFAPAHVAEIEGLAEGAEWSFAEAFVWNAKGDLRAAGAPPGHGCTTLIAVEDDVRLIAHNEDGAPAHRDDGFMVRCRPDAGLAFTSFAYPGLICGNSFAVNERGLVQTLNNVRGLDGRPGVPRQLVARAILDCAGLDAALALLEGWPRASGYHHGLAQAGDARLLAVEAPASGTAVRRVADRHAHANHLIEPALAAVPQIVTASSAARQERAEQRLVQERAAPLDVLLDGSGERSVHGRARGAEDSWTLATALFRVTDTAVALDVVQGAADASVFAERLCP